MAALTKLLTYWSGNSTLTGAVPVNRVYLGWAPIEKATTYPYVSLITLASQPLMTDGLPYVQKFTFEIHVWHSSMASLDSVCDTISDEFIYKFIDAATVYCRPTGDSYVKDEEDPRGVGAIYHAILGFEWTRNATHT